jgi:hypothetical protein
VPVDIVTKEFVQPLATLLASFAGAGAAFLLAGRRTKNEELRRHLGAIRRAILVLCNMHSNLETYRLSVTSEFAGSPEGWLHAKIKPSKSWGEVTFDPDALAFLLEGTQANLYAELMLEACNFDEIVQLITRRDTLLLKYVHPKLGKILGKPVPPDLLEPHIVNQLKNIWDAINERLPEQIAATKKLHDQLRDAAVNIRPDQGILKVVFYHDGEPPEFAPKL